MAQERVLSMYDEAYSADCSVCEDYLKSACAEEDKQIKLREEEKEEAEDDESSKDSTTTEEASSTGSSSYSDTSHAREHHAKRLREV